MGEYRYAIVELPPSPYAHDLQEVLAFVFDIGVNLAGCTGEQVAQAFMASGLASPISWARSMMRCSGIWVMAAAHAGVFSTMS